MKVCQILWTLYILRCYVALPLTQPGDPFQLHCALRIDAIGIPYNQVSPTVISWIGVTPSLPTNMVNN